MWDQKTGRSRGFGFVSFRNQQVFKMLFAKAFFLVIPNIVIPYVFIFFIQEAQSAINDLNGMTLLYYFG